MTRHPLARIGITLFIGVHLVLITLWNLPPSAFSDRLRPAITPYFRFASLEQRWSMFAPTPDRANRYLRARITYRDGSERLWAIGRLDHRLVWDKLILERTRKLVENVWNPKKGWTPFYPQICRWAAREVSRDPTRPPTKVDLELVWSKIPQPPQGLRQDPITEWKYRVIYTALAEELAHP